MYSSWVYLGYLTRFGRDTVESDAFKLPADPVNGVSSRASLLVSFSWPLAIVESLFLRDCIDFANCPLAGDAIICCTPSRLTETASRAAVSCKDSIDTAVVAFLRTSGSEERRISCTGDRWGFRFRGWWLWWVGQQQLIDWWWFDGGGRERYRERNSGFADKLCSDWFRVVARDNRDTVTQNRG